MQSIILHALIRGGPPFPSCLLDNIQGMVIASGLRGNIIKTAVCWTV